MISHSLCYNIKAFLNNTLNKVIFWLKSKIEPIKYIGKSYYEYTSLVLPFSITLYVYLCKLIDGNLSLTEHVDSKWFNKEDLKLVGFCEADKPFIEMIKNN